MEKIKILLIKITKQRTIRYLIAGGTAFTTNILTLFVLVQFFNIWYLLASIISFIAAFYVSFMLQKFFTFNDYNKERIKHQTTLYFGIQIFNLGLNTLLMYIGVSLLGVPYLISQVVIAGAMAVYNFFIYKHLVFTPDAVHNNEKN